MARMRFIQVQVPQELYEQIEARAKEEERSISAVVRLLLKMYASSPPAGVLIAPVRPLATDTATAGSNVLIYDRIQTVTGGTTSAETNIYEVEEENGLPILSEEEDDEDEEWGAPDSCLSCGATEDEDGDSALVLGTTTWQCKVCGVRGHWSKDAPPTLE